MNVGRKVQEIWKRLSSPERRELRHLRQHSSDANVRCRAKIVWGLVRGNSPQDLHRSGLCSVSQVYRVAERFVEQGLVSLADRREDNGQPKVTEEYEWELLVAVAFSPQEYDRRRPTWTQELLIDVLAERTGIRVSRTTMSRTLARLGVRWGRPKPIVACPWSPARKTRRLNAIRRLVTELPAGEEVFYVDEVDIHLNPKIGRDWMLPGVQKTVLTPGQNEKRYLAGALNGRTRRLVCVEGERKTSTLFLALLGRLIRAYPRARRLHVVLDNFRIHSSRQVQLALAGVGARVCLHFLPPYCPDHNRIERVWKDLHDNVTRNHRCRSMLELMDEVRRGYAKATKSAKR